MEQLLQSIGLLLMPIISYIPIYSIILPYTLFQLIIGVPLDDLVSMSNTLRATYRDACFNAFIIIEKQLNSSKDNAIARELLATRPLWRFFLAKAGPSNTDVATNYPSAPNNAQIRIRNRAYDGVPYCVVLFLCGLIIMNDLEVRSTYTASCTPSTVVPSVWNEFNKSHRDGQIGEFSFINKVLRDKWKQFLIAFSLDGSFLDPEWLVDSGNMTALLNEIQLLRSMPGNYMKVETAVYLPMNAGFTVSASCIDTSTNTIVLSARIHDGNKIPIAALQVYLFDAILSGRILSNAPFQIINRALSTPSLGIGNYVSDQFIQYIVLRMMGTLSNASPPAAPAADRKTNGRANTPPGALPPATFSQFISALTRITEQISALNLRFQKLRNKKGRNLSFKKANLGRFAMSGVD